MFCLYAKCTNIKKKKRKEKKITTPNLCILDHTCAITFYAYTDMTLSTVGLRAFATSFDALVKFETLH